MNTCSAPTVKSTKLYLDWCIIYLMLTIQLQKPLTAPIVAKAPGPNLDPTNVTVLYHANCPDGFGAAWAAWKVFGNAAQFTPYNHGDAPPDVAGRDVYMIDCCYGPDECCAVNDSAQSFTVLDHHQSNIDKCGDLPFCTFDKNRSGAGMAWDYFHSPETRPALVTHVENRDLYKWRHADSRAFCVRLDCEPRTFSSWDAIASMDAESHAKFVSEGRTMQQQSDSVIAKFAADARLATFLGHRVWLLNVPRPFATDDCGALLAARGDADFALMWNTNNLSEINLSLRSTEAFDVKAVAVSIGGGGHEQASGAKMSMAEFLEAVTMDDASPSVDELDNQSFQYFITYTFHQQPRGSGVGNMAIKRNCRIDSIENVRGVEELIAATFDDGRKIVLQSFVLMCVTGKET
jgi:oligoribonuclease NrnB/cAMP/cGMP phosphodiesterase (DHH superfamily)